MCLGTWWRKWLGCCAKSRKGFFIDIILSAALWPWGQPSIYQKWIPRIFPGGKCSRCLWLTLPPSGADCLEILEPQPPGTLRAFPGLYRDCFTVPSNSMCHLQSNADWQKWLLIWPHFVQCFSFPAKLNLMITADINLQNSEFITHR
jgi:hypothetical protein